MSFTTRRVGVGLAAALIWRLRPTGDGWRRLTTQFRGDRLCLDVFNGGAFNDMPHLAPCANVTGQFWRVSVEKEGFFRLTTKFRGPEMCLDVINGGPQNDQPRLEPCGDFSGQYWRIAPTGRAAP